MKKYQIKEIKEKFNHAGSKAVEDVSIFAEQVGYEVFEINTRINNNSCISKIINQLGYLIDWIKLFFGVDKYSLILQQNPYRKRNFGRELCILAIKKIKKCKFISIIHDVEELRGIDFNNYYKKEFEFMLKNSECLIVHNKKMKQYIQSKGYNPDKIVELDIFDYYLKYSIEKDIKFSKSIAIAGNLHKRKSGYIYELGTLKRTFLINLFGPNFNDDKTSNESLKYYGSFSSEEIPNKLIGAFGLVWDGDNINDCSGKTGNYLKYNNPHKTSLYLAAQIPIIIWQDAAMASYVKKNKIGFCIKSLSDIDNILNSINDNTYQAILRNTKKVSKNLNEGYYTKHALRKSEEIIYGFEINANT